MAASLVFGAVAKDRHRAAPCEGLQQAQSPFLAMVLDRGVAAIDRSGFAKFCPVTAAELAPAHRASLAGAQQCFRWSQRRHPNVVARFREPTAAEPGSQDA